MKLQSLFATSSSGGISYRTQSTTIPLHVPVKMRVRKQEGVGIFIHTESTVQRPCQGNSMMMKASAVLPQLRYPLSHQMGLTSLKVILVFNHSLDGYRYIHMDMCVHTTFFNLLLYWTNSGLQGKRAASLCQSPAQTLSRKHSAGFLLTCYFHLTWWLSYLIKSKFYFQGTSLRSTKRGKRYCKVWRDLGQLWLWGKMGRKESYVN